MAPRKAAAPSDQQRQTRAPVRDKPDSRPARLMAGAAGLAAVTILAAGLVDFPPASATEPATSVATTKTTKVKRVERPIRYVRLKPGQAAPKGAKVIREAAPAPRVVVQRVVVSAPTRSSRTVARSRQSGR